MKNSFAWGILTILVLAGSSALADDASDRKDIIEDIDDLLEEAADELDDVAGASSASDVSSAISYAEKVSGLISKLDRVKGDDTTAKDMVSRYPSYIRSFKESAEYLRKLKEKETSLKELPRKCQDLDANLQRTVEKYVKAKDSKGLEELPKAAKTARRKVDSWWRDAEQTKRNMEDWRSRSKRFSESHREWSDVKSKLHSAAEKIFDKWEDDWEKSEKACRDLKEGDDHPVVEKGLKSLSMSSKGRAEIIKQLERHLKDAASNVRDLHRQSSDSNLERALRNVSDIRSAVDKLKVSRGTERRAQEIVEKWPGYTEHLKRAIGDLRKLKKWQSTLDKGPQACEEADRKLDDLIRKYAEDSDGIKKLSEAADKVGEAIRERLKKADGFKRSMEDFKRVPERFSASDPAWRDVVSNVQSSAKNTYEYWEDALEKTHDKCDELAKGAGADKVKRALEKLGRSGAAEKNNVTRAIDESTREWSSLSRNYKDAETRFWALMASSKKLRKFDTADVNRLITFSCGQDHERDGDEASQLVAKMASTIVAAAKERKDGYVRDHAAAESRLKRVYAGLREFFEKLTKRADELERSPHVKKRDTEPLRNLAADVDKLRSKDRAKFFGMLRDDRQSYLNVARGALNAANNPKTKAASDYGKAQHKQMQGSSTYACAKKEYPAGGGAADCVSFEHCTVYEFKPSGYSERKALQQANKYLPDVSADFSRANGKGKKWEHCWKKSGPTGGAGFVPEVKYYEACK